MMISQNLKDILEIVEVLSKYGEVDLSGAEHDEIFFSIQTSAGRWVFPEISDGDVMALDTLGGRISDDGYVAVYV